MQASSFDWDLDKKNLLSVTMSPRMAIYLSGGKKAREEFQHSDFWGPLKTPLRHSLCLVFPVFLREKRPQHKEFVGSGVPWRGGVWEGVSGEHFLLDASFLLTVEVFCLRFVFFTYGGGTVGKKDLTRFPDGGKRKQKRPNLISGRGGAVSKKDQTDFHRKQKRPNQISPVSKRDQAN